MSRLVRLAVVALCATVTVGRAQESMKDWPREALDPATIDETLGVVLKAREDIEAMRGDRLQRLLARAMIHGARQSG